MTGWRLGYLCGPAPLVASNAKLHQYALMSSPTTAQWAAVEAIRTASETSTGCVTSTTCGRRLLVDGLNRMGLPPLSLKGRFTSSVRSVHRA